VSGGGEQKQWNGAGNKKEKWKRIIIEKLEKKEMKTI